MRLTQPPLQGSSGQRGDNVFDDAFRQGRDRQEGINFEGGSDDRSVCDVKSVVHPLGIVGNTFPKWSTTPWLPSSPIGQPPNGCAVTRVFQGENCQLTFSMNEAPNDLACPKHSWLIWSKMGSRPAPGQSMRSSLPCR